MGLVDLFRPKWKHSDAETRAAAVRDLGPEDASVLEGIAQSDKDAGVRRIAIKKLENPAVLADIARGDPDESLRQMAAEKATSILIGTASSDGDEEGCQRALEQIEDQRALAEVAKNAAHKAIRLAAVGRLTDERALAEVARNAKDAPARLEAIRQVSDAAVLRGIALNDERKEVCLAALERLTDREALEAVARKAKNKTVRAQARKQVAALGGGQQAPTRHQRSHWQQICETVEVLSRSSDWERIGQKIEQAQAEWDAIEGDPDEELKSRFEQAVASFFARYAEHQEQQTQRAQRERELQAMLSQRIGLCEAVERLAGEDAPERLEQLKVEWEQLGPIPPAHREVIEQRFAKACESCLGRHERRAEIEALRSKLEALCEEAERLVDAAKPGQAARRYRALETEWRALKPTAHAEEGLAERFQQVGQRLEERKQESQQRREQERKDNQARLETLCQRLEEQAASERTDNLKAAERLLREAQSSFKRLGDLPSKALREQLTERFQTAREKLFARVQELREAEDWKRWSVVPQLEELCVRVEGLAKEQNLKRVSQELKRAQVAWKKVGPAPRDKAEDLWKRFKQACDEAYARCQEYFGELERERDENLQKKLALCEEVEGLAESSDWEQTAAAIKEIQARWKKIGPVPRAQSDAIWVRFRKACDRFFNRRQEHLDQTSGERDENLQKKQALCEEVEGLAESSDWEQTAAAIKEIQARWKKIGPVPRAQSDAIWARFRKACDHFFDRRQQHQDQERLDNQARKEELSTTVEALLSGDEQDPAQVAQQVLEARAAWHEVGPVPQGAQEALLDRFNQLCEKVVEAHPDAFQGTELDPVTNQRRKEKLCQRVEELVQTYAPGAASSEPAESMEQMAEQLRSALAANALRDSAGESLDWQTAARETKRLEAQWRKIGPVPGEVGQALWDRFRAACDRIAELRPQTQAQPKEGPPAEDGDQGDQGDQEANLQRKQELCEQAEKLSQEESPGQHQDAIREIRRQWKAIGPVPKSKARRLWNRFRRACNRVMADAKRTAAAQAEAEGEVTQAEVAEAETGAKAPSEARPATAGWDTDLDSGWDELFEAEEPKGDGGDEAEGREQEV